MIERSEEQPVSQRGALRDWIEAACRELGVDPGEADAALVLDLAKDVAHQVVRPGAPVTAYLLGLAVGRGADPASAAARLGDLARSWPAARAGTARDDG